MVLAALVAASPAAAAPEPGPWTSARGLVRFDVDAGTGLIQPTVRYRARRCGSLRSVTETVGLGLAARTGRRFLVVQRHRLPGRRAVVRLRLAGRFDSSFEAHGVLRGRIRLRGRPVCRIAPLRWSAEAGGPPLLDDDEALGDGEIEEELEEDDCEDCEPLLEDEEPDEEP